MAVHEAQSYKDPGTPQEQTRRTFLANATVAMSGVIGLVLAVPLVSSLIPESLLNPGKSGGTWATLPKDQFDKIAANGDPIKVSFNFQYADGYFPPEADDEFMWGIKLGPDQEASFKAKRPDLYTGLSKLPYPSVTLSYVMFSSVCPHLGCRYEWNLLGAPKNRFACPCHGSQFTREGVKLAGPAPRGLDPLPFREKDGQAQVTWIQYKSGQPDRVIVSYS